MPRATAILLTVLYVNMFAAHGQERQLDPLQILTVGVASARPTVTESWGVLHVTVSNTTDRNREARVIAFFPAHRNVQYGRDVWVPAKSSLSTWVPIGPTPPQPGREGREVELVLYDRTDGQNTVIFPAGQEKVRSAVTPYRRREATTVVLLDDPVPEFGIPDAPGRSESPAAEAFLLARVLPLGGQADRISIAPVVYLPPTVEAFDGVDSLVLAGNRLSTNPVAIAALRRWVQQGGKLWVMLDRVDPASIASVLGKDADLTVVDRVALTTVSFSRTPEGLSMIPVRDFEKPIEQVRVIPGVSDRVMHYANGWPASFVRRLGKGEVMFTTLGARAWHRPRTGKEPMTAGQPDLPVPMPALEEVAAVFRPRTAADAVEVDLRPVLTEDIGYSVIGRNVAAGLLAAFVLILAALGLLLRRSRRPEWVGWAAPTAAVVVTGVFVALGESLRRAVPPTVATVAEVDAVSGSGEAAVSGLFAVYEPASGAAEIASHDGALLNLDAEGLEGQKRLRIQTDADDWHWENLSLPAGVRSGSFRSTRRTGKLEALGKFGPAGLDGQVTSGPLGQLDDAILVTSTREPVAVRTGPDGAFTAIPGDALAADQFVAGAVLTDRQQRRQAVYRQLLGGKVLPEHLAGRNLLVGWSNVPVVPFASKPGTRVIGSTLLVVPLELERTPPATPVTIPRAFVPYRRVLEGGFGQATMGAGAPIEMRLRFQLPAAVLPLNVEKATLLVRVRCPSRRFSVAGYAAEQPVSLLDVESPAEPIRVEIADTKLLQLDAQGGLHLRVKIGDGGGTWAIETLGLDVVGRTADEK